MLGGTIALPSQAGGCEQVTSEDVWGHDCVTIAGLWQRATYQRRCLGTRLRYLRRLVAVNYLPAKMFGDTIAIPSQACGCEQLTSDDVWGHDCVTISGVLFGDTIALPSQACDCEQLTSEDVWGHDCVTIASLSQ